MLTAILFVLMLLVLVIPHEWGHMMVARLCGVKILEFSVGMGPLILKRKKGDTQYSLRLLPLGGYCMMEGEEQAVESPSSYSSKTPLQKAAILLAGVTMNVIIALLAVTISLCISGIVTNTIAEVTPGSPAAAAGVQAGDTIVAVNGSETDSWEKVVAGIDSYDGKGTITVTCERDGERIDAEITPEYNEELQGYKIGIMAGTTKNVFQCMRYGPSSTWELTKAMLQSFAMIFSGQLHKDDIAGPVGLVKVVDTAASYGPAPYFTLLALVSLNLAFFNLLPIPGLDGGKLFFLLLNVISRGKINDDMEYKATIAGMVLLLSFFVLITVNDVMNIFGK